MPLIGCTKPHEWYVLLARRAFDLVKSVRTFKGQTNGSRWQRIGFMWNDIHRLEVKAYEEACRAVFDVKKMEWTSDNPKVEVVLE
ncbi:uncharacterized protein N0V89_007259 [Didymosphaeria variabile]|uniref:Uncharacterized protein n=1 Tax=Didymosphaeria variabile TaxID=1932322 RepID=A0A9W8XII5_9PLEO|nr:uncharacterized protein N0V89_007259 [Didymosphaeria variabile]KAJ4351915.1 hypothetical protein N0V89_007259 [Didymosphaeria variabile]